MFWNMSDIYQQPFWFIVALLIIGIWSAIWTGLGLWYSAQNQQKGWFIALLILNTMGLLPIIYLLWFRIKCTECEDSTNVEEESINNAEEMPESKVVVKKKKRKKTKPKK